MKYLHWASWFIICKRMDCDPMKEREKEKRLLGSVINFGGIVQNIVYQWLYLKAIPFEIAKIS